MVPRIIPDVAMTSLSLVLRQTERGSMRQRQGIRSQKKAAPRGDAEQRVECNQEKLYIDGGGGAGAAAGCCAGVELSAVLVISRTSTRRFLARPSRVLFESTGLSLPSPIR